MYTLSTQPNETITNYTKWNDIEAKAGSKKKKKTNRKSPGELGDSSSLFVHQGMHYKTLLALYCALLMFIESLTKNYYSIIIL